MQFLIYGKEEAEKYRKALKKKKKEETLNIKITSGKYYRGKQQQQFTTQASLPQT